ncbi:MAG: nuclear transport factor 2 family protein [Chitinophagaceae bacterium]
MTTQEIANRLVVLCRQGHFETAQKELFSEEAISIEPYATPAFEKETKGLSAIFSKGKKFEDMVQEYHKIEVSEPLIVINSFACTLRMELTMKKDGHMDMTELCVYSVKDGKIIKEEFFM